MKQPTSTAENAARQSSTVAQLVISNESVSNGSYVSLTCPQQEQTTLLRRRPRKSVHIGSDGCTGTHGAEPGKTDRDLQTVPDETVRTDMTTYKGASYQAAAAWGAAYQLEIRAETLFSLRESPSRREDGRGIPAGSTHRIGDEKDWDRVEMCP